MKHKKSKFWTFIWSFLPGAAEMYMGYMKNGISIMAVFFASLIVPSVLRVSDVFILMAILVWFYGFFHARNLAAYSEEELLERPDSFVWESLGDFGKIQISNPTLRKWGAVILIIYGLTMLWQTLSQVLYFVFPENVWVQLWPVIDEVPRVAVALIIIVLGAKLIAGKKGELDGKE